MHDRPEAVGVILPTLGHLGANLQTCSSLLPEDRQALYALCLLRGRVEAFVVRRTWKGRLQRVLSVPFSQHGSWEDVAGAGR